MKANMHVCLIGRLDTRYYSRSITVHEMILNKALHPDLLRKRFHRYVACPICGKKIRWTEEEKKTYGEGSWINGQIEWR